ncbi:response regulator transcription factor [Acetatifactor aquisgranensis]|uniref:response regulator transcription factor n=1 Tax=Acetatifactor aquisgranensis TaxID=2941233 RepID=UPI00203F0001|nr:response regulator [Acetatifactor aquisgranensis]
MKKIGRMEVLVVDDDPTICQCLQQLIDWEEIGCGKPLCAHNGADALAMMEETCPDIVVCDIKMPVMDGKELCRLIYEKYPAIHVFFVSAYEDFATAQIAIRYHVKGYVLKPLDKETLKHLQNMIYEVVNQQENAVFCRKIYEDEYRDALKCAIEEKSMELPEGIFAKLEEMQDDPAVQNVPIWPHLLAPIIEYRNSNLKMDLGILFETERRMKREIMECSFVDRIGYLRRQYQDVMKEAGYGNDNIIWEIQKVIRERFSSPDLDVNVLAQLYDMSPVYLGRLYLERTGMKITEYIQENRIRFACSELRYSYKSIKEIAMLSGYRDAGYFNKVFRRKMNMTPVEYRERYWEKD